MDKIFLKPKAGLQVRNMDKPGWPHVKESGEWLTPTRNVLRRLRDGDLEKVAPPAPPPPVPKQPDTTTQTKKG